MNPKSKPLISAQEIQTKITQIAKELDRVYAGKELTLVVILKGAIFLAADLMRSLRIPTTLEFVRGSSYGMRGTKPGQLSLSGFDELHLQGRDVLLIDDIFDTGETLTQTVKLLQQKNPQSLATLVLLTKQAGRKTAYIPTYSLFTVADRFVVGYGLDYKEHLRGLPDIRTLEEEQ